MSNGYYHYRNKSTVEEKPKVNYDQLGKERYTEKVDKLVKEEVTYRLNFLWGKGYPEDKLPNIKDVYEYVKEQVIYLLSNKTALNMHIDRVVYNYKKGSFYPSKNVSITNYVLGYVLVKITGVDMDLSVVEISGRLREYAKELKTRPLSTILLSEDNFENKAGLLMYMKGIHFEQMTDDELIFLAESKKTGRRDIFYKNDIPKDHKTIENITLKLHLIYVHEIKDKPNANWTKVFNAIDGVVE